jgi:hypothetical protein
MSKGAGRRPGVGGGAGEADRSRGGTGRGAEAPSVRPGDTASEHLDGRAGDDALARLRRHAYLLVIALAAGLVLARIAASGRPFASVTLSSNDRSRWATAWALVDNGTWAIDETQQDLFWATIDAYQKDGHSYSTKPPLLSTLVAGEYWLLQRAFGWTLRHEPGLVVRTVLMTFNLLPFVLYLAVLAGLAEEFAQEEFTRLYLVATAALGTLLTPFLATLNNHTVAAFAAFFATAPYVAARRGRRAWWRFALSGFLAALAASVDLLAAVFAAGLLLLWLACDRRRTLLGFVPGALVPAAAFLVTNRLATGSWLPHQVVSGAGTLDHPYWQQAAGIDALAEPKLVYAFHAVLGHHGILLLSPVFLLTLAGFWLAARRCEERLRPLALMTALTTVVVVGFYVARTGSYGGQSVAFRWVLWLVPQWLLCMIPALDRVARRRPLRLLASLLLLVSAFSAAYPGWTPWEHPWALDLSEHLGITDYLPDR